LLAQIANIRLYSEEYMFTTLAGSGGPAAIDGPGASARFNSPEAVALDAAGNLYVADSFNETIRKIASNSAVTTVAGFATVRGADDGTGADARFDLPAALVLDTTGNIYVADQNNHLVRKITPDGLVTTLAGFAGRAGTNDGVGLAARFNFPGALAIDPAGNLYVADTFNHTIRKMTAAGEVSTFAGSPGASGSQNGTGGAARFNFPSGLAFGNEGKLYVADTANHVIRTISTNAEVTTLAGAVGQPGSSDGPGNLPRFNEPQGLATDSSGNLYVADSFNHTIRKVSPGGFVSTLAGNAAQPDPNRPFISFADGTGSAARFKYPYGVAVDSTGNIYVADRGNDAIRRITPEAVVSTVAGSRQTGSDDGPGSVARFRHPTGAAVDKSGSLFVVDGDNNTIRQISPSGIVTTIAGLPGESGNVDGTGSDARFTGPRKLAFNAAGDLFVADTGNSTVRKLTKTPAGAWNVTTFAGQPGSPGFNDGPAASAQFKSLYDIAIDAGDNLYIADKDNQVIRKITPDGTVSTRAGQVGVTGAADGQGDQAQFNLPYGIAVDRSSGVIYVADTLNQTIRKITSTGLVSTLAGQAGMIGNDDGLGSLARFSAPYGVAIDGEGNIYVADYFNNLIRKVTPAGLVTTIGGRFEFDPEGYLLNGSSDGLGRAARFFNPKGITVSGTGTVYVADSWNNAIRIGTTNFCPDQPIVDEAVALVGIRRQLDTQPQTAVSWKWSLIRQPANSHAVLSSETVRNPTFTPDVPDTFVFELRCTNALGAASVRTLSIAAVKPPPTILSPSVTSTNGQFSFTFEGLPGTALQVQVSDDLTNWLTLGTFQLESSTFSIIDSSPAPRRGFYRVRQL
jgi:sugar lactone lactonase YvrE